MLPISRINTTYLQRYPIRVVKVILNQKLVRFCIFTIDVLTTMSSWWGRHQIRYRGPCSTTSPFKRVEKPWIDPVLLDAPSVYEPMKRLWQSGHNELRRYTIKSWNDSPECDFSNRGIAKRWKDRICFPNWVGGNRLLASRCVCPKRFVDASTPIENDQESRIKSDKRYKTTT